MARIKMFYSLGICFNWLLYSIVYSGKNLSEYISTGEFTLSTFVNLNNLLRNIDTALPKIERQIVRQNEKKKSIDRQKLKKLPFEFASVLG